MKRDSDILHGTPEPPQEWGMIQVAPMIPRCVWDEVEKTISELRAQLEDDDSAWAMDQIITREILSVLERRGCLCAPSVKEV